MKNEIEDNINQFLNEIKEYFCSVKKNKAILKALNLIDKCSRKQESTSIKQQIEKILSKAKIEYEKEDLDDLKRIGKFLSDKLK